jgi:hypothetical protein
MFNPVNNNLKKNKATCDKMIIDLYDEEKSKNGKSNTQVAT